MITVGVIGRPHGIRGEVTVTPQTDAADRFAAGSSLLTESGAHLTVIASRRSPKGALIVSFEGVRDRNQAEDLRGSKLQIRAEDRRPLGPDEYWPEQLVGLRALDPAGSELGVVERVEFGPQERLVIGSAEHGLFDVPFVEELVPLVDLDAGHVVIDPIEGLFG